MNALTPILDVRELVVRYGAMTAVDRVSFTVKPGEIFGFLGPNGAGKTSTLSAIEGLLGPTAGAITVAGVDALTDSLGAKAKLGVQLQATSFQPELTVREIIRLFAGLYGLTLSNADVTSRLAEVQLQDVATRRIKQLSGGQQQRVSLIVATLHNPPLVLLDEPTVGLDPQSRRQFWDRLESVRREGHSILLTTHSMEEAQAVCDRIAIIDHAKLITIGTPSDLIRKHRADPAVKKVARGAVTLEDVFIGLTGTEIR